MACIRTGGGGSHNSNPHLPRSPLPHRRLHRAAGALSTHHVRTSPDRANRYKERSKNKLHPHRHLHPQRQPRRRTSQHGRSGGRIRSSHRALQRDRVWRWWHRRRGGACLARRPRRRNGECSALAQITSIYVSIHGPFSLHYDVVFPCLAFAFVVPIVHS